MASRASFSDDLRMIKRTLPKSALLRDYLLDDMSSCSSNGFRSYPRRQGCTATVRFRVETDLNKNAKQLRSNYKPKQSSVLQKASEMMINAFKHLRFAGAGAGLSRSLSRKLLKHRFWKKTDHHNKEVKRLTSFADLLKEKEITPPPSPVSTAVATAVTAELTSSTSNSNSWSGNNFTAGTESLNDAGNYSEVILAQNDVADELLEKMTTTTNGKRVDTSTSTTVNNYSDSTENATQKEWQDKHEEQFSPVSVMDFPTDNENNDDDENEISSLSQHKRLGAKGSKVLTEKTRVSERVSQLEPVKLEDRIARSVLESSIITFQENQIQTNAMALFQLMKSTVSSHHLLEYEAVKSVLLGFFEESALEKNVPCYEMLQSAKDWMDGQEQVVFIDWENKNNRKTYLRDMEKGVKWSNYDHEFEKLNVGFEVECEIFNSLINDVLTELNLQEFRYGGFL